jgi:serine/threonine protein kinase
VVLALRHSNASLILALARLSSALSAVYNFAAENIEMHKIGFHHDVKPKNILVSGANFILADFGLSRFKDPGQTSGTPFKMGEDYGRSEENAQAVKVFGTMRLAWAYFDTEWSISQSASHQLGQNIN